MNDKIKKERRKREADKRLKDGRREEKETYRKK